MKRAIVLVAGVLAFLSGILAYDLKHPNEAEAGGGGIGLSCGTGSGGAVCTTSPTLTTPNIGVASGTRLTLTQGISGVTGVINATGAAVDALTVTGAAAKNSISVVNAAGNGAIGVNISGTTSGYGIQSTVTTGRAAYLFSNGSGGAALYAESTGGNGPSILVDVDANGSGVGIKLQADTTSPTWAPLEFTPQDANPTQANIGDLYVYTGGSLRVATSASPVNFSAVANFGATATAAAAGTNQATATALTTADFYTITGADGTKGVTLPQGAAGSCLRVMSQVVGSVLNVYGHNSDNDTINGGAADAVYAQLGGTSLVYCTADGTAWFTY